jgi:5-methylthioadenosine/S-adenosylhomocysteine deaminase
MTHCLETINRKKIVNQKYHTSTVKLFDKFDLLDKNTVLFHCTHVDNDDIELIADRQSSIVYCPISNYWSGAGYAPLEKFLQEDINVLLGTDFLLTDLWEVMRNTYYYLKTHTELNRYKAEDIFKMVTTNAHRVLAPEMKIGIIDIDYKADLQFIDKTDTTIWPLLNKKDFSNILHNILMHGRPEIVKGLMIDGRWVMKDNYIIPFDEEFINKRYRHLINKLYGNF